MRHGQTYRTAHINSFDFCQPITDVYCAQLTKESAQILKHSIYLPFLVHTFPCSFQSKESCCQQVQEKLDQMTSKNARMQSELDSLNEQIVKKVTNTTVLPQVI